MKTGILGSEGEKRGPQITQHGKPQTKRAGLP